MQLFLNVHTQQRGTLSPQKFQKPSTIIISHHLIHSQGRQNAAAEQCRHTGHSGNPHKLGLYLRSLKTGFGIQSVDFWVKRRKESPTGPFTIPPKQNGVFLSAFAC